MKRFEAMEDPPVSRKTEKQKMLDSELYNSYDEVFVRERERARRLTRLWN